MQFGLPSLIALYSVRAFLLSAIPNQFFLLGYVIEKNTSLLIFFSVLMLVAGSFMIRQRNNEPDCIDCPYNSLVLFFAGFAEGTITGIVGAGGGFIIVSNINDFRKVRNEASSSKFIIDYWNKIIYRIYCLK